MAFMRNSGDITPEESLIYSYWSTMLHLLKLGVAWEAISNLTEGEVSLIIGIDAAYQQKEQDDQARQMAQHKMPSMAGMGMPSL